MLRFIALVIAASAVTGSAAAQGLDELIDFVLRPGQEAEDEDIWDWDRGPEASLLESQPGPPLLGPTGEEEIGPPLLGPNAPLDVRERLRRDAEADPFAAIGVQLGPFMIRPSIEIGVTATDNVARTPGGPDAVGLIVAPAVNMVAEGDRHELEIDLSGEGVFYDRQDFNTRDASARVIGRYDLSDSTSLVGEGGYAEFREDLDDPDTPGGAAERPTVRSLDASLGVEQRMGRLSFHPSAFVDRGMHDDVPLSGGGAASRRELDNTQYGGRLRTGFALGAGVTPFTEVAVGRRDYDQQVDDSGFRRTSLWGELSGGLIVEHGDKLSGEMSVGFRHEELEDAALPDIDALLVNAAIVWSPQRLTEVRVDLFTDVLTTSVPDESGTVLYSGLVTLSRRVTPRVRLAGGGGVDYEYSIGGGWRDVTFTGFAETSYAFSRTASVVARYVYERLESSDPGFDYDAHTVGVRLRLQR